MQTNDFQVFCQLLAEVHSKAFQEPITKLPHSKAQMLSFLIEEATGALVSYKSLGNFVAAALAGSPSGVNPNTSTLAILARFVGGGGDVPRRCAPCAEWFRYRAQMLQRVSAA
jgi:hypothetical protein